MDQAITYGARVCKRFEFFGWRSGYVRELLEDGSCICELDRYDVAEEVETFALPDLAAYQKALRTYGRKGRSAPDIDTRDVIPVSPTALPETASEDVEAVCVGADDGVAGELPEDCAKDSAEVDSPSEYPMLWGKRIYRAVDKPRPMRHQETDIYRRARLRSEMLHHHSVRIWKRKYRSSEFYRVKVSLENADQGLSWPRRCSKCDLPFHTRVTCPYVNPDDEVDVTASAGAGSKGDVGVGKLTGGKRKGGSLGALEDPSLSGVDPSSFFERTGVPEFTLSDSRISAAGSSVAGCAVSAFEGELDEGQLDVLREEILRTVMSRLQQFSESHC
jgi:hypothetical protein